MKRSRFRRGLALLVVAVTGAALAPRGSGASSDGDAPGAQGASDLAQVTVRHADGTLAPGVIVCSLRNGFWSMEANVQDDGRAEVRVKPGETLLLRATPRSWGRPKDPDGPPNAWSRGVMSVTRGGSVTLTLDPIAVLVVRVRDAPGPMHGSLREFFVSAGERRWQDGHLADSVDGDFRFTEVRPGVRHTLHVWQDGGTSCAVVKELVAPSADAEVVLEPVVPLYGRITPAPRHSDVAGVLSFAQDVEFQMRVGVDGRFAVMNLPNGFWALTAYLNRPKPPQDFEGWQRRFYAEPGGEMQIELLPREDPRSTDLSYVPKLLPLEAGARAPDPTPPSARSDQPTAQPGAAPAPVDGPPSAPVTPAPDPGDADAWARRGGERLAASDAIGALGDALRALELDPKHPASLLLRAEAKRCLGDLKAALAYFAAAEEADPGAVGVAIGWARALRSQGDVPGALRKVEAGLIVHPKRGPLLVLRAQLKIESGDFAGAVADGQAASEASPGDARACLWRWVAGVRKGDGAIPTSALKSWAGSAAAPEAADAWVRSLVDLATGKATFDSLLAAAEARQDGPGGAERRRERKCQVYAWDGFRLLAAGDPEGARRRFALASSVGAAATDEHAMATTTFKALKSGR